MIRLFVPQDLLHSGQHFTLEKEQVHYLLTVMRRKDGDVLTLFNGRHGAWLGNLHVKSKKAASVFLLEPLMPQKGVPDVWLCFAPVKKAQTDFIVQKATELGAARLCPVMTKHTVNDRIKPERLKTIALEAAEQSERLTVPSVEEARPLKEMLIDWPKERRLYYLDETGASDPFPVVLAAEEQGQPAALLTGPEGGFAQAEIEMLKKAPFAVGGTLGPRILKAETAVVTALSVWMSVQGDWAEKPAFRAGESAD